MLPKSDIASSNMSPAQGLTVILKNMSLGVCKHNFVTIFQSFFFQQQQKSQMCCLCLVILCLKNSSTVQTTLYGLWPVFLLLMAWPCKEPGHQYQPSLPALLSTIYELYNHKHISNELTNITFSSGKGCARRGARVFFLG